MLTLLALTGSTSFAKRQHKRLTTTPRYTTRLKNQKQKNKQQQARDNKKSSKLSLHYAKLIQHILNNVVFLIIKELITRMLANDIDIQKLTNLQYFGVITLSVLAITTTISYLMLILCFIILIDTRQTRTKPIQKMPTITQCFINSLIIGIISLIVTFFLKGINRLYTLKPHIMTSSTYLLTFLIATYTSYTNFERYRLNSKPT